MSGILVFPIFTDTTFITFFTSGLPPPSIFPIIPPDFSRPDKPFSKPFC